MAENTQSPTGPIIDELLCFIVNKMNTLDTDTLIRLCSETYSEDEAKTSKDLVFGLLHNKEDPTSLIKRHSTKVSESKKVKDLRDILQLLQEKGTTELPQFVALDLGNLPPITFDHIDVTALLSQIEKVKTKVDAIQGAIQGQIEVSDSLVDSDNVLQCRVKKTRRTF